MNYLRHGAVLGLVLLLTASNITFASAQVPDAFVPSTLYDEAELMPYPTLAGPLSLHAVGPSGEFNSSQEIESLSSGIAILNWTHTPGVELQYNTSGYQPECMEYAYFAENLSWDHAIQPTALNMSAYVQVNETGSFKTHQRSHMFSIQVWILGDEIQKREVGLVYSAEGSWCISRQIYPSDFHDAFDSLIQHPGSQVQLAIALIPSSSFMDYQGNYTGSVEVITREIHLSALYRTNPDAPFIRASTFNNTWRMGDSDRFVDSCLGRDGSMYILSHQSYSVYLPGDTLTQVNSGGEIVWRKSLNATDLLYWSRVIATSDEVFVFGSGYYDGKYNPVLVDVVSNDGTKSDVFSLDTTTTMNLGGIDISSDGYLYIGMYGSGTETNTLSKAALNGSILWVKQFGDGFHGAVTSVQVDESGNVYTFSQGQIIKWDSEGNQLWERQDSDYSSYDSNSLYVLRNGSSILVSSKLESSTITELDSQGNQAWSFTKQIRYTPHWREFFYITWMTESPSGLLYALYTTYGIHQSSFIAVMSRDGTQVENYTVSFGKQAFTSAGVPNYRRVYIADNDVMYLVGRTVNNDYQYSITLAIYGKAIGGPGDSQAALIATSSAAALLVGAVVYLEYYRKRKMTRL